MALNVLHIVASTVSRLHVHESLTTGLILWLPAFTSPSACNSSINQERQPCLWHIWTFEFKSLSYRMTLKISIIPKSIPHHWTRTRWEFLPHFSDRHYLIQILFIYSDVVSDVLKRHRHILCIFTIFMSTNKRYDS